MSRIEFVSPLSLNDCISRLRAISNPPGLFGYSQYSTVVDIFPHDYNTRFYRISQGRDWSLVAAVEGALVDSQRAWTIVTAETAVPKRWYLIYAAFFFGVVLGVLTMTRSGNFDSLPFLILFAIAGAVNCFWLYRSHQDLLHSVEKLLR
jgi:hypothetical protein